MWMFIWQKSLILLKVSVKKLIYRWTYYLTSEWWWSWQCWSYPWLEVQESKNMPMFSEWQVEYYLSTVNQNNINQSWTSLSSCMSKRVNSPLLCWLHCPVMHHWAHSEKTWLAGFMSFRGSSFVLSWCPFWLVMALCVEQYQVISTVDYFLLTAHSLWIICYIVHTFFYWYTFTYNHKRNISVFLPYSTWFTMNLLNYLLFFKCLGLLRQQVELQTIQYT